MLLNLDMEKIEVSKSQVIEELELWVKQMSDLESASSETVSNSEQVEIIRKPKNYSQILFDRG